MKLTDLRVLLSIDGTRIREPVRTQAIQELTLAGLVYASPGDAGEPALTDRGMAYVDALVRLPLPEQVTQWVVPSTKADDAAQAELRG